jgi:hypothetical protein
VWYSAEESNINEGQRWAAANIGKDPRAAPLTVLFANAGGELLYEVPLSLSRFVRWTEDALTAARFLGNQKAAKRQLLWLAMFDYELPPNKGTAYFREALSLAKETKDRTMEAKLHENRVMVEVLAANPVLAMRHAKRAIEIYNEITPLAVNKIRTMIAESPSLRDYPLPNQSGF